jgi:hypothetical protein
LNLLNRVITGIHYVCEYISKKKPLLKISEEEFIYINLIYLIF